MRFSHSTSWRRAPLKERSSDTFPLRRPTRRNQDTVVRVSESTATLNPGPEASANLETFCRQVAFSCICLQKYMLLKKSCCITRCSPLAGCSSAVRSSF